MEEQEFKSQELMQKLKMEKMEGMAKRVLMLPRFAWI